MQSFTINIRPRRQTTIPKKLLDKLGVGVGDNFKAYVKDNTLVFKPKKQIALEAFKEIQKAFAEIDTTEEQMLKELKEQRHEVSPNTEAQGSTSPMK